MSRRALFDELFLVCGADTKVIFRIGGIAGYDVSYGQSAAKLLDGRSRILFEDFCKGRADFGGDLPEGMIVCGHIASFPASANLRFSAAICKRHRLFGRYIVEMAFIHGDPAAGVAATVKADAANKDMYRMLSGMISDIADMWKSFGEENEFDPHRAMCEIADRVCAVYPNGNIAINANEIRKDDICVIGLSKFTGVIITAITAALKLSGDENCTLKLSPGEDSIVFSAYFTPEVQTELCEDSVWELYSVIPSASAAIAFLSHVTFSAGTVCSVSDHGDGALSLDVTFRSMRDPEVLKYRDRTLETGQMAKAYIEMFEKHRFI